MLPVNARGKRPQYEMEQVVPGSNFAEEIDPIMEANELKDNGDTKGARKVLMELCRQDLRCLDAHAHLGNLVYQRQPEIASEALRGRRENRGVVARRRIRRGVALGIDR